MPRFNLLSSNSVLTTCTYADDLAIVSSHENIYVANCFLPNSGSIRTTTQ